MINSSPQKLKRRKQLLFGQPISSDLSSAKSETSGRDVNSLQELAKRFLKLLSSKDQVDLNIAASVLNVAKRRIYDITNVLEGIGLVHKVRKNIVRLKINANENEDM